MPRSDKPVCIILASYNGAAYIGTQIASIQAQTFRDWHLYVRDDGSTDNTVIQVEALAAADDRITLVQNLPGRKGAIGNFAALMQHVSICGASYVFFSDQDDFWLPHKLATQLAALQQLEDQYGVGTPLLVHSDLAVVNQYLQPLSDSFIASSHLCPAQADMGVLLAQNQITGCATLINRALLEVACPLPDAVRMHDWWVAFLAAGCGKIGYLPHALIQYRQHQGNAVGALAARRRPNPLRAVFDRTIWTRYLKTTRENIFQAGQLLARLEQHQAAAEILAQVRLYAYIQQQPRLLRAVQLHRHGIRPNLSSARWAWHLLLLTLI